MDRKAVAVAHPVRVAAGEHLLAKLEQAVAAAVAELVAKAVACPRPQASSLVMSRDFGSRALG